MIMTKFSPPAGRRCPPGRARTAAGGGADLSFVHIIWNPVAGNGAARAVFVRVRELLASGAGRAAVEALVRELCPAGGAAELSALSGELMANPPAQGRVGLSAEPKWRLTLSV